MVNHANLADLLARTTPYERWRAPLDDRVRWGAMISGPVCLGMLVLGNVALELWLPGLGTLTGSSGVVLTKLMKGIVIALMGMNLSGLLLYGPLLVTTNGLREGSANWQWIAFGEALLCAFQGALLAVAAVVALVVCLFWFIIAGLIVLALFAGFFAWAADARR